MEFWDTAVQSRLSHGLEDRLNWKRPGMSGEPLWPKSGLKNAAGMKWWNWLLVEEFNPGEAGNFREHLRCASRFFQEPTAKMMPSELLPGPERRPWNMYFSIENPGSWIRPWLPSPGTLMRVRFFTFPGDSQRGMSRMGRGSTLLQYSGSPGLPMQWPGFWKGTVLFWVSVTAFRLC